MSSYKTKEETMVNENEAVSHSEKESELLSVEPFDLEGFNSNGQFSFKRNYLRGDAYNDFDIDQYFSCSISSQLEISLLEPASAPIHSEVSPQEFKLQGFSNTAEQDSTKQNLDSEKDSPLLGYHMGHMSYFGKRKNPIFPQSRKFMKTKKKSQRNQSYYAIACKYMANKCRESCKRFDQKLQQEFQKLPLKQQEDKDETYEAIRHLLRAKDSTCQSLLKNHREKYLKKRYLAIFLQKFVNGFALEA